MKRWITWSLVGAGTMAGLGWAARGDEFDTLPPAPPPGAVPVKTPAPAKHPVNHAVNHAVRHPVRHTAKPKHPVRHPAVRHPAPHPTPRNTPAPVVTPVPSPTLPPQAAITPSSDGAATPEMIHSAVPPYVDRGVVMVPMRPICDFLHAKVLYSDGIVTLQQTPDDGSPARTVMFRTGGAIAQLQDGDKRTSIRLPLPIEERLGTIFMPLRLAAQAFGAGIQRLPDGDVSIIKFAGRTGILTPVVQEGYRGKDAAKLTIVNNVGRALSLRLSGPQRVAVELGCWQSITRSLRPGVYYYRAASTGMKPRSGARRLLAGRKASWAWGHR